MCHKPKSGSCGLRRLCVVLLVILLGLIGMAMFLTESANEPPEVTETQPLTQSQTEAPTEIPTETSTEASTEMSTEAPTEASTEMPTEAPTEASTEMPTEAPTEPVQKKRIVIDAGHQETGNSDKEPIGPGATALKAKVTGGTKGTVTGLEEYKLNLIVAQKLQRILEERGYEVVMIRTTHDVNISNAERAQIANELHADAFVRIHANGSGNSEENGILTICQTKENPYNAFCLVCIRW